MLRIWGLALVLCAFSTSAHAATKNILLTGYWTPSNDMLRRFSPNPELNPEGWIGRNWRNSGYDVYAHYPQFPAGSGSVGVGDFRVDFASAYNDFIKYTDLLSPIAIVSFGVGSGPWEIEAVDAANFQSMFASGNIPSVVNQPVLYPIPDSLKEKIEYRSTLPMETIAEKVNSLSLPNLRAWIDHRQGAGDFLCAFIAYLGGWYQEQHKNPHDPAYNAMAGFVHINTTEEFGAKAVEATLEAIVESRP